MGLSFALVGITWMTHHRRFNVMRQYSSKVRLINLPVLFFVGFLPASMSLLFERFGNSSWPPIIYAATIAGIFLSLDWLWHYGYHGWMVDPRVDDARYQLAKAGTMPVRINFLLPIPLAVLAPGVHSWIFVWPVVVLFRRALGSGLPPSKQKDLRARTPSNLLPRPSNLLSVPAGMLTRFDHLWIRLAGRTGDMPYLGTPETPKLVRSQRGPGRGGAATRQ